MLFGTHFIAGAAVGEAVGNPFLAFLLGFVLHFLLDSIPHFDTTDDRILTKRQIALIVVEGIIGMSVVAYCYFNFSTNKAGFLAGGFGSILPDLLDNVPFWDKAFQKTRFGRIFHDFHGKIQSIKLRPILGLSIQAAIIVIGFLILQHLR